MHQARDRALVLGESVAFGVDAHLRVKPNRLLTSRGETIGGDGRLAGTTARRSTLPRGARPRIPPPPCSPAARRGPSDERGRRGRESPRPRRTPPVWPDLEPAPARTAPSGPRPPAP